MYIHLNIHKHKYMHTCIHAYMHASMHTYIHTYMHACIHTYTYTYAYTYIHTYIRTYIHTYVRTYRCTYVHTYIIHITYLAACPPNPDRWRRLGRPRSHAAGPAAAAPRRRSRLGMRQRSAPRRAGPPGSVLHVATQCNTSRLRSIAAPCGAGMGGRSGELAHPWRSSICTAETKVCREPSTAGRSTSPPPRTFARTEP